MCEVIEADRHGHVAKAMRPTLDELKLELETHAFNRFGLLSRLSLASGSIQEAGSNILPKPTMIIMFAIHTILLHTRQFIVDDDFADWPLYLPKDWVANEEATRFHLVYLDVNKNRVKITSSLTSDGEILEVNLEMERKGGKQVGGINLRISEYVTSNPGDAPVLQKTNDLQNAVLDIVFKPSRNQASSPPAPKQANVVGIGPTPIPPPHSTQPTAVPPLYTHPTPIPPPTTHPTPVPPRAPPSMTVQQQQPQTVNNQIGNVPQLRVQLPPRFSTMAAQQGGDISGSSSSGNSSMGMGQAVKSANLSIWSGDFSLPPPGSISLSSFSGFPPMQSGGFEGDVRSGQGGGGSILFGTGNPEFDARLQSMGPGMFHSRGGVNPDAPGARYDSMGPYGGEPNKDGIQGPPQHPGGRPPPGYSGNRGMNQNF